MMAPVMPDAPAAPDYASCGQLKNIFLMSTCRVCSTIDPVPGLYLLPLDDSFFPPKRIPLSPPGTRVRIGRQLNQKSAPGAGNRVFESRVLSRQHAEAWVENGRMLIRDVKSSNGTLVNGERLSPEDAESDPYELCSDDILEFGIDIVGEHRRVVHRKVAARVTCAFTPADATRVVRAETRVYPPPSLNPPPVPSPPPSILGGNDSYPSSSYANAYGIGPNGNGVNAGNSGDAQRRPQQGTGLPGMGGMGAKRIRPKSGVDFDSMLARIKDAHGHGHAPEQRPALPAAFAL